MGIWLSVYDIEYHLNAVDIVHLYFGVQTFKFKQLRLSLLN